MLMHLLVLAATAFCVQPLGAQTASTTLPSWHVYSFEARGTVLISSPMSASQACDEAGTKLIQPPAYGGFYTGLAVVEVSSGSDGMSVFCKSQVTSYGTIDGITPPDYPFYFTFGMTPVCPVNTLYVNGRCEPPEDDPKTCTKAGNPVLVGSGVKVHDDVDYLGSGAHPLSLRRSYRSRWPDGLRAGMSGASMSGRWYHSLQAHLATNAQNTVEKAVRAFRPDGNVVSFLGSGAAAQPRTWRSEGSRDQLTETVDANGQTTGFRYTDAQTDSIEAYDAAGQLLSVVERNGWTTTLSYSTSATPASDYLSGTTIAQPGLLIGVKNAFGRELRMVYDPAGRLVQLLPPGAFKDAAPGTAQAPIRYSYDAAGNLTSVTWQDGSTKRYHYEDSRWPHALTGLTDEANIRVVNYAYDEQGRTSQSERGGERYLFGYGGETYSTKSYSYVTAPDGASRTYTFEAAGGVIRPTAVSAPCPLCGTTAQSTTYNATGDKTKEIAHDGTVIFFTYDSKGRETERATFAASYSTATTRPALSNASKVVSTKWHATFNLPTQVAEPNKLTTHTYNAKGMLTGQSWTATTDATGAAKFNALKTGSTYATGWGYNANSLATSSIEKVDALETKRWTMAYAANGNLTRIVDVKGGNRTATMTQYDAHGRMLSGTTDLGVAIALTYTPRGAIARQSRGGQAVDFAYNAVGNVVTVRTPDSQSIEYVHDVNQVLVDVKLNGVSITPQMLADSSYPDTQLKAQIALARQWLILGLESLMSQAHAQPIVVPGGRRSSPAPDFDPGTGMLTSPMTNLDRQVRGIQELFARCQCDPKDGYPKPEFTKKTFAHVFYGGHYNFPMFSDQSYFTNGFKPGQALVDQVVSLAATQPGSVQRRGTRDEYSVFFGTNVGVSRDPANPNGLMIPAQYVFMVVEKDNCASRWKFNEVVTIYPRVTATQ
jgi:YD repeat-containing protein